MACIRNRLGPAAAVGVTFMTLAGTAVAGQPGVHDGFYLRLGAGLGYLVDSVESDTVLGSEFQGSVTGVTEVGEVAVGGGLSPGLFLGGGTDADILNTTFYNNATSGNAGALWAGNGTVTVTNVTFANNDADYGPAIFKGQTGTVTLKNVIMSNNSTSNEFSAVACHETFDDGGGNVQWPDTKNNGNPDTPCAESVLFQDPELAPLGDNGGFTETMALPAGSPAIDVSDNCPETDQRGEGRVGRCDSGAFEHQG